MFGENFPYTNFHDLNLDWIIKIAKDFLDQYTHIQEIIEQGEEGIQTLTDDSLTALQDKKEELEGLLDQWYETHSNDIADQLADALDSIATTLQNAEDSFDTHAEQKAEQTIASIPDDYTELSKQVDNIETTVLENHFEIFESGYIALGSLSIGDVVNLTPVAEASYQHCIIGCSQGDVFTVTGTGGVGPRAWAMLDSDNKLKGVAYEYLAMNNEIIVIPSGVSKLVINAITANPHAIIKNKFGNIFLSKAKEVGASPTVVQFTNASDSIPASWGLAFDYSIFPAQPKKLVGFKVIAKHGGRLNVYIGYYTVNNKVILRKKLEYTVIAGENYIELGGNQWVSSAMKTCICFWSVDADVFYYNSSGAVPARRVYVSSITELCSTASTSIVPAVSILYDDSTVNTDDIIVSRSIDDNCMSLTSAVDIAKDGDRIFVRSGLYDFEVVKAWGKNITIIGEDRYHTIIQNQYDTYSLCPLEMCIGSLENITIKAIDGGTPSQDQDGWLPYALHTDHNSLYEKSFYVHNCSLLSELNSAVGMGTRGKSTVEFNNCDFWSKDTAPFFFHDTVNPSEYGGTSRVYLIRCVARNNTGRFAMIAVSEHNIGCYTVLRFINNVFVDNGTGEINKYNSSTSQGTATEVGNFGIINFNLTKECYGNNLADMNY